MRQNRETGLSDAFGAIIMVSVVGLGIALAGMFIISQPLPSKIPAVSADITTLGRDIVISHNGGDSISKSEMLIVVDGADLKDKFTRLDGTAWSTWSVGDSLNYTVPDTQTMPAGIAVYYIGGCSVRLIQSRGVPSALNGGGYYATVSPVPAPVADFTGSPLTGSVPLTVSFTDLSTGSPTLWNWSFGDIGAGNRSTSMNPSHTYTQAGTYSVSLVASNDGGNSTKSVPGYITVNVPAPGAAFTATPLSGTPPLAVTFTDTSANAPTAWRWSYRNVTGNNTAIQFSTLQNPAMSFGVGNYSIVLNASNPGGYNISSQVTFVNVSKVSSLYSYYREITVTNTPAVADYQMMVTVPYSAHMKSDFGDIRFIGTDGTTTYNYWMQEKTDGSTATFWVKVPTASTAMFRMYYGNATLVTTSDGTGTFDFFDDFSGDLSKWTREKTSGVYPLIESGYLNASGGITSGTFGHTSLGSSPTYNGFQDGVIEFRHRHSSQSIGEVAFRGVYATNRGYKGRWDARSGSEQVFLMPPYSGWANLGTAVAKWNTAGPWYLGKMVVHGTTMDLYDDGSLKGTVTDPTYATAGEIALQNHYGTFTNFDDIRVRKYAAPEPTTSIGSEISI